MKPGLFIAGDWGTTRLRLFLCDAARVLDVRTGDGVGALTRSPAQEFAALVEPWMAASPAPSHAVICGMAGSRNGWRETPYVHCPAAVTDLRDACVRVDASELPVSIVPGLACSGPLGAPDVMRGEETQVFGALSLRTELAGGRHLVGLPGTHTKWAVIEDGRIVTFQTALTGEMFALLRQHSILMRVAAARDRDVGEFDDEGFAFGLADRPAGSASGLLHSLFQVRSRQLMEGASPSWALGFLSGLLIGADVDGALGLFGADVRTAVSLIGAPALTARYAQALRTRGIESSCLEGDECSLAGLRALAGSIENREVENVARRGG